MRRTYNAAADVRSSDCLELTRRLHKNVMDIAKKLDEQKSRALSIADLFTPSGESLRVRLKDYCERLIFKDPVGHARKTEELLWRKGFYDVVHSAKKLQKGNSWTEAEKALVTVHLAVGVGFYHHLVLRLQLEYDLNLVGVIDFAYVQSYNGPLHGKNKTGQSKVVTEDVRQCVMRLIHRSLVCLGDLARYRLELDPNWDPMIARRYYKMAIAIDPNIGMPHNQLGTVAGNKNFGLDAVYHYMRCILCTEPFEGAEGNLKRAVVTHSTCIDDKCSAQHCVSRLLSLVQLWDYEVINSQRINQECQDLLTDVENCLTAEHREPQDSKRLENEDSITAYLQTCKNEQTTQLTDDMIFKIVAVCLMSISRLKSKESNEVQGVVAITLAVLSQLVQCMILRLQDSIIEVALPNIDESIKTDARNKQAETSIVQSVEHESKESSTVQSKERQTEKMSIKDEITDLNDNKAVFKHEQECVENGIAITSKKSRDKAKSLLTKLRRRKRRDSSDSDVSENERTTLGSSSDEGQSDVSETEDEILSENALSDDALSEDISDDEKTNSAIKAEDNTSEKLNGHVEQKSDINANETKSMQNGESKPDERSDEMSNAKDSANSDSGVTVIKNVEANDAFEETGESSNTAACVAQLKKQTLKADDVLNILTGKEMLASIKICCDWLKSNQDIVRICAKSSRILLKRITVLLNLISISTGELSQNADSVLTSAERLRESVKTVPLPEDIDLKGLSLLDEAHKNLDWKILHKYKLNKRDETLLRTLKLIEFGHYLISVEESGVKYNESNEIFMITDLISTNEIKGKRVDSKDLEGDHPRGKLMRHMGRLWLKAEVRALETRLRSRLMSPYLVPDHEALAKYTHTLKRLVYAKKFIVVIPSVVVSALDEVKRISGKAREATRWLEAQLRRGSRFLRAQRPHERLALPLIKGPRPKDKEAWLFFQIIECCHYLTQQSKMGMTEADAPVVTLLTGCNPDDKKSLSFSPDGLAKSAGVNLEHIESFHTKWKASSKSHG